MQTIASQQQEAINSAVVQALSKQFVRPSDFQNLYGISRGTVFNWMREGRLPAPRKLSARVIGWDRATLDAIFSTVPQDADIQSADVDAQIPSNAQ